MILDLHAHSTISDGTDSHEQLIDTAINAGVEILALCDHDTIGDDRFLSYAKTKSLCAIQGIELSAEWGNNGACHIVGLGVKRGNGPLDEALDTLQNERDSRNKKILSKLRECGCEITEAELQIEAAGDVAGRPHMAALMIKKGFVDSIQSAFDGYLAKGGKAYVDRFKLTPELAISLLTQSGAKAVIAHPTQLGLSFNDYDTLLDTWKKSGLWGIEIYTPYTPVEMYDQFLTLAKRHNLAVTGGSDYHGTNKTGHFLGELKDGLRIGSSLLGFADIATITALS